MAAQTASQPLAKINPVKVAGSGGPTSEPKIASIGDAIKLCRGSFVTVGIFSAAVNILMLTPPMYMLSAYDRVLASGSIPTRGMTRSYAESMYIGGV